MQLISRFSLGLILVAGFTSCTTRTVVIEEAQEKLVLLPDSSLSEYSSLLALPSPGGQDLLALYDPQRQTELFFTTSGKETARVHLQLPDSLLHSNLRLYVQTLSADSVLLLCPSTRSVFIFNAAGKLVKKLDAVVALKDGSTNYRLNVLPQSPVLYDGKRVILPCTRMDMELRTEAARKKYFSTPPWISIDLRDEKLQQNTGTWPSEYTSGGSYRDFYPQACINGKGNPVCGFSASDSLFEIVNERAVGHLCKSKFMGERHAYPDDSLGHFDYLQRYLLNEPRYLYLVYDPYRHLYYRIVHHALAYEKSDGMTLNDYQDKPWSLMILDEQFRVLNEISFDPNCFLPAVYPVKDGLLIRVRQEKNYLPPIGFSLFKIRE